MDLTIVALLAQDGITNGAVYALLALALVLVFAVTRVIWIPSGEFVAYGTLTLAGLQLGKPPGTIGLLVGMAALAGAMEVAACLRAARRSATDSAAARRLGSAFRWPSPRHRRVARDAGPAVLGADPADAGARHGRSARCSTASPTSRSRRPACWCC